jgi:hypothetical protein
MNPKLALTALAGALCLSGCYYVPYGYYPAYPGAPMVATSQTQQEGPVAPADASGVSASSYPQSQQYAPGQQQAQQQYATAPPVAYAPYPYYAPYPVYAPYPAYYGGYPYGYGYGGPSISLGFGWSNGGFHGHHH